MKDKQHKGNKKNTGVHNSSKKKEESKNIKSNWIIIGILIIAIISFFPSLKNGFVNWDDYAYVVDNQIIKDLSFANIKHIFNTNTYIVGNYHPFTVMSFCFEYHFFKLEPFIYHLDNILLHLLNVFLVFRFLILLNIKWEIAGITALLFAVHPMRVESVTWVAERKDVLYTSFFFLSLNCYLLYIKLTKRKWYNIAMVLFVFSILSKGQAVVLPMVLVLVDYFLKRSFNKKVLAEKIPFFGIAIFFGVIALLAQHVSLTEQRIASHPLFERILIANYGIIMYLYKLIIPLKLTCFYPYPDKINGFFYIAPVIVILLIFLVYKFAKQSKEIIFGGLFFIFTISIVLQLLPVGDAVIAERYTYIPYLGLFFIMASGYNFLIEKKTQHKLFINIGVGAYFLWLVFLTFNQSKIWKDSKTLWTDVISKYPENAVAFNNRGVVFMNENQLDSAHSDFENAIKYKKNYFEALVNKGTVFDKLGKYDLAIANYNASLQINPGYVTALFNRGLTYVTLKQFDQSISDYTNAMQFEPKNYQLYYSRAIAYNKKGQINLAFKDYTKAIELNPYYDDAYINRGNLYIKQGKVDIAIADYNKAIIINPANGNAYYNRSTAYFSIKDYKTALKDAMKAKSVGYSIDDRYLEVLKSSR